MTAAEAYAPWTSDRDAEQIRREVEQRELVNEWAAHHQQLLDEHKRYVWHRIKSVVVAFAISVLGVGMFLLLAICWGAR